MILRGTARPHGDTAAEVRHLEVECVDFNDGKTELRAQVSEGWDLLHTVVARA